MTTVIERAESFYVVGGSMRHDARSYVERTADRELYAALVKDEFCHVLTARQMGKSSLMLRTAARLRESGVGVAVLDLTAIGQNLTVEQWYSGLLIQIGERLNLEDSLLDFWGQNTRLGPMQRWVNAIRRIVLPQYPQRLVVFVDEIDAVRSLNFSTDEFFAGIRECYNLRTEDHDIQRLTFCLLGVASPSDLIQDTRTTPFNIGQRIELNNFTKDEASTLAAGLSQDPHRNMSMLERVLYWTSGHPYLTQRICQSIAENPAIRNSAEIDRFVDKSFFSKRAQEYDDNLIFVRERLLRSGADIAELLGLYSKVRRRKPVHDDESNTLVSILRLSGITRTENGLLRVRNRIYERVFNEEWIKSNLPDFELKRQREAYRRGVLRTAIISSIILAVVSGLAVVALWQRHRALDEVSVNHRLLYLTRMKLINQEWQNANAGRMQEMLDQTAPLPGEEDLRGFEWFVFSNYTHSRAFHLDESNPVKSVRYIQNGNVLAIGDSPHKTEDGKRKYIIKLHDLKTNKYISFETPSGPDYEIIAFSPDGKHVITNNPENGTVLLDLQTGNVERTFEGTEHRIKAIAFSPDSRYFATGDLNGAISMWDIQTGERKFFRDGPRHWVRALSFSPDGRDLTITDETNSIQVIDTITGKTLASFSLAGVEWTHAIFSADARTLISTSRDGKLYFWDVRTRKLISSYSGHSNDIQTIALSPDGKTVATGSIDRSVKLWDVATGKEIREIKGHGSQINSIDWSPDGKWIVTADDGGSINVWDVFSDTRLFLPRETIASYRATAFTSENELMAVGVTAGNHIKLWNLSTGLEVSDLSSNGQAILIAVFSKDSKLFAFSGIDHVVRICRTDTGEIISTPAGQTAFVFSLDFSPDGKTLLTGDENGDIRMWEISTGRLVSRIGTTNCSYRAAFSPDGKLVAYSKKDGSVELWDISSAKVVKTFNGHSRPVGYIAFSIDGKLMATAGDNKVKVWHVADGKPFNQYIQSYDATRMAFTADGKRLVTGGDDGSIKLWDLTDLQEVVTFKERGGSIYSIYFSADGNRLAVSSLDSVVNLWKGAVSKD